MYKKETTTKDSQDTMKPNNNESISIYLFLSATRRKKALLCSLSPLFSASCFSRATGFCLLLVNKVVVVIFQIIFRIEMHANNIFLFFKNYFWHQHIKTIQNIQVILNFNKNKFFKNTVYTIFLIGF